MIKVALLTIQQKEAIKEQLLSYNNYFNPIQDFYGNWIISIEEVECCNIEEFYWVKELPLIDYVPIEEQF